MIRKKWYILIIISILALSGCDEGLRYNRIEIEKHPSKLVYYIGMDNELYLSDGKIKLTTIDGTTSIFGIEELLPGGNRAFEITHSVDFAKPGFYTVEIRRTSDLSVQLIIQVVDPES